MAPRFEAAGLGSCQAVARSTPENIATLVDLTPDQARTVWLHAPARQSGVPEIIKPATFPLDIPVYHYDIETYGRHVYLCMTVSVHRTPVVHRTLTLY
jgi:hypothetical protein